MKTLLKMKKRELVEIARCFLANWIWLTRIPKRFPKEEGAISPCNRSGAGSGHSKASLIPKIIWMYWETVELPRYIVKIVDRAKMQNPDHEVVVLSNSTLRSYLPEFEITGEMLIAHKADIIRLELLYKYGGIWLDCTTILNKSLEWVHSLDKECEYDLIGYYRDLSTTDYSNPAIETWFLCARPLNAFLKEWLDQLSPLKSLGSKRYYQMISLRPDYETISQQVESPKYLLPNLACQIAMRKQGELSLYLKKAEDSALYLLEYYKRYSRINYALCRLNIPLDRLPIIKLTSGCRSLVPLLDRAGLIKKKSIMGAVLGEA
jgi:hypothetical protein